MLGCRCGEGQGLSLRVSFPLTPSFSPVRVGVIKELAKTAERVQPGIGERFDQVEEESSETCEERFELVQRVPTGILLEVDSVVALPFGIDGLAVLAEASRQTHVVVATHRMFITDYSIGTKFVWVLNLGSSEGVDLVSST